MPVEIKTVITRKPKNSLDRPLPIVKVSRVSDTSDSYRGEGIIPVGRGRTELSMVPSDEGPLVRETVIVYGDELDDQGRVTEQTSTRSTVLASIGDSFRSTLRMRRAGRSLETHAITFTRVAAQAVPEQSV